MKVFISWSGSRSEAVAKSLRDWLPLVLHYVEPWMSQSDIDAGDRWSAQISKGLESCNFGIVCLTQENFLAPWILFEAGALAKSIQESKLIPLLLDISLQEISGPLAQFQSKKVDQDDMFDMIRSLNNSSEDQIIESKLKKLFDMSWPAFESEIKAIPKKPPTGKHGRPQGEILEELVSSVRALEMKSRDVGDEGLRIKRPSKFSNEILFDVFRKVNEPSDPIIIILLASFFRNEIPWLYEMAYQAYQALRSGDLIEGRDRLRRFQKVMIMISDSPFFEELGLKRSQLRMMLKELDMMTY